MRGRCVSGHVGRSSRIRTHDVRNALTERAWKDAVQGLGKQLQTTGPQLPSTAWATCGPFFACFQVLALPQGAENGGLFRSSEALDVLR